VYKQYTYISAVEIILPLVSVVVHASAVLHLR
jgi:hypothetical protein